MAERLGLGRGEVLVEAAALRTVRDRLRAVSAAVRTVERDLRRDDTTYEEAFGHLYAAAYHRVGSPLGPGGPGGLYRLGFSAKNRASFIQMRLGNESGKPSAIG